MKQNKQPGVVKRARKHTTLIGAGVLAAAIHPALAQEAALGNIDVDSNRPVRSGYKAPNTTIGKRQQDVQDIPQSATVINQQVMKDQATTDLKEALKNAGITFQAGEGGQTEVPIIRGMHAGGDVYDDGMRGSAAQFNSDTYNTDRVEVLKGSAAVLFGRGAAGGVINQVSKSPYIGTGGDLALGVGNRDHYRFTADVNHAFNDDIAVRLNVMGDRADSRREPVNSRKWGIAPSIAFGLSGDTQFELSYKHDREDRVPDFGVPYLRTGSNTRTAAANAVDQFYGFHTDFEDIQRDAYTAKFRHRFNDRLRFDNTLRYSRTQYQMLGVPPRLTENANGTYTIARNLTGNGIKSTHYDAGTWSNHSNLNWLFDTGSVQHDVLFNLELTRERRKNYDDNYTFFDRGTGVQVRAKPWENLHTLTPGAPADDVYYQRNTDYSGTLTTRTIGLGINDIISITPTFKAIAGIRYNHIKTENDAATGEQLSRSDGIWTYNGSLVWDYAQGHNLYATYSTAVTPVAYRVTGQSDSLDPTQLVADPEETRTVEIGSKNAFFEDALTVNAALFHTKKTQQYYRDAGFIDWAKVYGLDVEVAGRITPRWNIIGNLVWSNGSMRATSPSTVQLDGHFPEGAAKFTANVWTNYRITDTVNAGFGLRHVGDRYTHMPARGPNPVMVQKLPSYTVADAMVSYENRNYRVQLNVNNLFDKKHFTTGHRQQAIPGERRNVLLTLGYRF